MAVSYLRLQLTIILRINQTIICQLKVKKTTKKQAFFQITGAQNEPVRYIKKLKIK